MSPSSIVSGEIRVTISRWEDGRATPRPEYIHPFNSLVRADEDFELAVKGEVIIICTDQPHYLIRLMKRIREESGCRLIVDGEDHTNDDLDPFTSAWFAEVTKNFMPDFAEAW